MTTEDDFQRALDADPWDWQTRLVFADWLEERGDPRAPGFRAMGTRRQCPACWSASPTPLWGWLNSKLYPGYSKSQPLGTKLPDDWYDAVPRGNYHAAERDARRKSEDDAALAFVKHPVARQAELLAEPPIVEPDPKLKYPSHREKRKKGGTAGEGAT
jgi:uncharacterized protein (TIGR02996 family)